MRGLAYDQVTATESVLGSIAIHQSLYHPALLSLFCTFPDPDSEADRRSQPEAPVRYIVLEHAGPHGTLSDHLPRLNPPSTEESRVRGVVKTLVDALTYLEKQNVVHRRLVPDSVYVTEDFRVVSVHP
jgi:polo-like kinase 4